MADMSLVNPDVVMKDMESEMEYKQVQLPTSPIPMEQDVPPTQESLMDISNPPASAPITAHPAILDFKTPSDPLSVQQPAVLHFKRPSAPIPTLLQSHRAALNSDTRPSPIPHEAELKVPSLPIPGFVDPHPSVLHFKMPSAPIPDTRPSVLDFKMPSTPIPDTRPSVLNFKTPSTPIPGFADTRPSVLNFKKPSPIPSFSKTHSPLDYKPPSAPLSLLTPGQAFPVSQPCPPPTTDLEPLAAHPTETGASTPHRHSFSQARARREMNPCAPSRGSRHPIAKEKRFTLMLAADNAFMAFVPGPILIHTQDRSTLRPPRSMELMELDPNTPRARGECRNYNVAVRFDEGLVNPKVGDVVAALSKVFERALDPDPSPDPAVRALQDSIDKMIPDLLPQVPYVPVPDSGEIPDYETDEEMVDRERARLEGDIHKEALKTLPSKITTTSHYRYVLATLKRDKVMLREQIETDRDIVAAMDVTVEALKNSQIDNRKGKSKEES